MKKCGASKPNHLVCAKPPVVHPGGFCFSKLPLAPRYRPLPPKLPVAVVLAVAVIAAGRDALFNDGLGCWPIVRHARYAGCAALRTDEGIPIPFAGNRPGTLAGYPGKWLAIGIKQYPIVADRDRLAGPVHRRCSTPIALRGVGHAGKIA